MIKQTIVFLLCSLFLVTAVQAQEEASKTAETEFQPPVTDQALNLSLSPISLIFNVDPGTTKTETIKVRNNGIETEYLETQIVTFEMVEGNPVIRPFQPGESHQEWVSFSEDRFQVKPGEWKSVEVSLAPPDDAGLNYNYAIIIRRQATPENQEGQTTLIGAPAILTLANVTSDKAIREMQVVDFSLPKIIFEYLPVEFTLTTKNTGNVFLAPFGNIFVDGNGQKDLAILSINPDTGYVLPGSERTFKVVWDEGFPVYKNQEEDGRALKDEEGNPVQKLKWNFSEADQFRIGKYTANLIFVYDNGTQDIPIESQVSFWVIPWKLLAISAVVVVLALLGLRSTLMSLIRGVLGVFRKKPQS